MKMVSDMKKLFEKSIFVLSACFVFALLMFSSCRIGLGPAVDLEAPTVSILSPESRESVPSVFTINGTAGDNIDVTLFILKIDTNEWKYEKGSWTKNGNPVSDCVWEKTSNVVGKREFRWEVKNVSLPEDSGEYTIHVNAYDSEDNTSKDSIATRTIIYDKKAPQVNIISPEYYNTYDAISSDLKGERTHKNNAKLSKYLNNSFEIQVNQEESFELMYFKLFLLDVDENTVWKSPLYLSKKDFLDAAIKSDFNENGELYDEDSDTYEISSSLRNFKIKVPELPLTGKTYLKIKVISRDAAGNTWDNGAEDNTVKHSPGWICYWQESDRPWIECDSIVSDEENAKNSIFYPGTKIQVYAYDDDGIKSVNATYSILGGVPGKREVELYSWNGNGIASKYQTSSLIIPPSDGLYKIKLTVKDIYSDDTDAGESLEGFFWVSDINAPKVNITSPVTNETLFGDKDGNVVFEITADDDSGIKSLKCVYLRNEADAAYYMNAYDSHWDLAVRGTAQFDKSNNILWNIELDDDFTIENDRHVYKPKNEFKLNIFNSIVEGPGCGLGIDGVDNILGSQHFIFCVTDNGENKTVLDYSIQGDLEPPSISFKDFYIDDDKIGAVSELGNLSVTLGGKKIKLTGTWNDNSTAVWQDVDKLSEFSIKWNGVELENISKTYSVADGGEWTAEIASYSPAKYANGSAISLSATISDYAGNKPKTATAGFLVDSIEAALESITANKPNGSYNLGEEIPIILKFNKPVTVTGTPVLKLNNGGTAEFDTTTNGTQNLSFNYEVKDGEDNPKIDVVDITGTAAFKDGGSDVPVNKAAFDALRESNKCLINTKSIEIITQAPKFTDATISGDTLILSFSANISKNKGDIVITQKTVSNVPAVLTEAEYRKWRSKDSHISTYYTKGTNGSDNKGTADLTTKYILNFDVDSNNETLVTSYKSAGFDTITISVKSSAVTIVGNKLNVSLEKFPLPCKGAEYTVSVPDDLVVNKVGAGASGGNKTVTMPGVETPVIRINKSKWSFDSTNLIASQPLSSTVKIDCETPSATIRYGVESSDISYDGENQGVNLEDLTKFPQKGNPPDVPSPDTDYSVSFEIGDSASWKVGQKIFIVAEAKKGTATSLAYEMAYRSVFVFDETDEGYAGGGEGEIRRSDLDDGVDNDGERADRTDGYVSSIWIRGGDAETGPVTTAGFPLSWNEKDYSGAALLTQEDSLWYYITWELTTTAYIGVMAGVTDELSGTQGPLEWCYGKNSWVPFKKWYCLFPGESRYVSARDYHDGNGTINGEQRGVFGFKKETVDRNGVKHNYLTSGSGGTAAEKQYTLLTYTTPESMIVHKDEYVLLSFDISDTKFQWVAVSSKSVNNDGNQQIDWNADGVKAQSGAIYWKASKDVTDTLTFKFIATGPLEGADVKDVTIDNINVVIKTNPPLTEFETPKVNVPLAGASGDKVEAKFTLNMPNVSSKATAHFIAHYKDGTTEEKTKASGDNPDTKVTFDTTNDNWYLTKDIVSLEYSCTCDVKENGAVFETPATTYSEQSFRLKKKSFTTPVQHINLTATSGQAVSLSFDLGNYNLGSYEVYVTLKTASGDITYSKTRQNTNGDTSYSGTWTLTSNLTGIECYCVLNAYGYDFYNDSNIPFNNLKTSVMSSTELLSGSITLDWNTPRTIPATSFTNAVEGAQIIIIANTSGLQANVDPLGIQVASWSNPAPTDNGDGTCTYVYTLTASDAAKLKSSGMSFKGSGTITSVKLATTD